MRRLAKATLALVTVLVVGGMLVGTASVASAHPVWTAYPVIHQGDVGGNVVTAQLMLRAHGYMVGIDGVYGPGMHAAVHRFQSAHGLVSTGVINGPTWQRLIVPSGRGSIGWQVLALQLKLHQGYGAPVSGYFGTRTVKAVKLFQAAVGLPVTGYAGPWTWHELLIHRPFAGAWYIARSLPYWYGWYSTVYWQGNWWTWYRWLRSHPNWWLWYELPF